MDESLLTVHVISQLVHFGWIWIFTQIYFAQKPAIEVLPTSCSEGNDVIVSKATEQQVINLYQLKVILNNKLLYSKRKDI